MTGIQVLFLFQGNTESTCISRWARLFIYFVGGYNQLQNVLRIRCQNSNRGPWYEICVVLLERRKRNTKVTHTTVCIDVSQDQNLKNVWMKMGDLSCFFLSTTQRTSPHLVIVYLLLCDGEYQQNVVFHHLINELAERWILLKRKNDNRMHCWLTALKWLTHWRKSISKKKEKKRHHQS